ADLGVISVPDDGERLLVRHAQQRRDVVQDCEHVHIATGEATAGDATPADDTHERAA
ncbi:MAG: hypothetical protein ACI9WU_003702, partial [Myxococcota bacterium]